MGSLPGWMPIMLDRINWGCSTSPWFVDLADEHIVLERGRKILFALWPYVRELPVNISAVRDNVPQSMLAATQLLGRLGDGERQYQKLFTQQFDLARVSQAEIDSMEISSITRNLCDVMSEMCTKRSYVDGIHAIVAAELSATMYCRSSVPLYENYFEKHSSEYEPELIEAGLEWVRLHAKTHMRHAIWMKRMLTDVDDKSNSSDVIPEAAEAVLNAILALWECPVGSVKSGACQIS